MVQESKVAVRVEPERGGCSAQVGRGAVGKGWQRMLAQMRVGGQTQW